MKVKDLLEQSISVDVYDDVCEELAIAFDGPMELTDEGKKKFREVLNCDVSFVHVGDFVNAIVHIDDEDENVWERRLRKAIELFEGMAGYCACEDYDKWFVT